jgi:hypothetical protein
LCTCFSHESIILAERSSDLNKIPLRRARGGVAEI